MSRARAVPLGRLQTQAELDRLKALLAAFPTSEAEDALLLSELLEPSCLPILPPTCACVPT